jgi:hypothetical protein
LGEEWGTGKIAYCEKKGAIIKICIERRKEQKKEEKKMATGKKK